MKILKKEIVITNIKKLNEENIISNNETIKEEI